MYFALSLKFFVARYLLNDYEYMKKIYITHIICNTYHFPIRDISYNCIYQLVALWLVNLAGRISLCG